MLLNTLCDSRFLLATGYFVFAVFWSVTQEHVKCHGFRTVSLRCNVSAEMGTEAEMANLFVLGVAVAGPSIRR
jgi:hypothetical protein